jgi:excisionase family DNA binding protein
MSNNITSEKLAYSIEELSALTTLSKPKIRKDIRNGKLESLKKGSRRLILKDEAIRYLSADDSPHSQEKQVEDR